MTPADWISLFSAVFAAIAVLLPLLIKRIEKRDLLVRTRYLIELLKAREELHQVLDDETKNGKESFMANEAKKVLEKIERQISAREREGNYSLFIVIAFAEAFLFIGTNFDRLIQIVIGPSYESGFYFLEGIFKSPEARITLLVLCVSLSVVFTLSTSPVIRKRVESYYWFNLLLLGIFNVCLVLVTIAIGLLLAILDPLILLW